MGFDSGRRGKAKDLVMWTVRIPAHANGSSRAEDRDITIDPKGMTHEQRREVLVALRKDPELFDREYAGPMTVEFFRWTKDGIPSQAKAVAPRRDGI